VSTSPSDTTTEATPPPDPLAGFAGQVAAVLDAEVTSDFGTIKARVPRDRWVETVTVARDELGLVFFSWLSAIDWSNEVEVGDPPQEPVEERYEVLCGLSELTDGRFVVISTDVPKDDPSIPTLVPVYRGANWHEREASEMFGITFTGHPNPARLYLPSDFEGNPLRKSFPLLTREVKPWPGKVDVEDMPSEENVEADETVEIEDGEG
jgi:NADH-quinone oxidoreductase subunit C